MTLGNLGNKQTNKHCLNYVNVVHVVLQKEKYKFHSKRQTQRKLHIVISKQKTKNTKMSQENHKHTKYPSINYKINDNDIYKELINIDYLFSR